MPEICKENQRDCQYLPRIEALEKGNEHNKDAHKEFYPKLESSHTTVALIEERVNQIKEDTEEIKENVQELKAKPAKMCVGGGASWKKQSGPYAGRLSRSC